MDVKPVSGGQTSFNGYIGPNLKQYVNIIVKKNVNKIVHEANLQKKPVDKQKIIQAKSEGDNVLEKFSKYMAKTQKNTLLDLNDIESSYMRLQIKNPVAHWDKIDIYSSFMHDKPILRENMIGVPEIPELNKCSDADNRDLNKLKKYVDSLFQINPKAIDKTFLSTANYKMETEGKSTTGFWGKRKLSKLAQKIEKFAREIGEESTATTRLKEYFRIAKESKLSAAEQKLLEKENRKAAEEILKS